MTPRLRPMRIAVLATVAVVAGVAAWALLVLLDARSVDVLTASWLAVPPTLPVGLLVVAVGLAVAVRAWRQRVSGHPDARPLEPLSAARAVAAAKASGAVGAVVGGAYLGYAAYLVPDAHSELRTSRLVGCAAVVVCSVLVVAAAVALERVLRLPDDDEDDPSGADRR